MKATPTAIPEVLVLEPKVFGDERGFFYESFNEAGFADLIGRPLHFVQDNHSRSSRHVLRGLHYQIAPYAQAKIIRVTAGEIFDVAVDLRQSSPTYGQWVGEILSAENKKQVFVPEGFAHGFLILSEYADVAYKTSAYYSPPHDRSILWNDKDLSIDWPISPEIRPVLSDKDRSAQTFLQADKIF